MVWTYPAWTYPEERYYYGWYDTQPSMPTDGDIKSMVCSGWPSRRGPRRAVRGRPGRTVAPMSGPAACSSSWAANSD